MEQAIKKAIDGGYKLKSTYLQYGPKGLEDSGFSSVAEIYSDPLFWQALGKSVKENDNNWHMFVFGSEDEIIGWKALWYRFTNYLISGKSADEFFNELLK